MAASAELDETLQAAFVAWNRGDLVGVEAICREVLAAAPDSFDALRLMAAALHARGRFDEALPCFERAARLHPGDPETLTNLAACLHELGRDADAMATCDAALEGDPNNAGAHYNRGLALEALGELEAALYAFDQAAALRSGWREALAHRAGVLHHLSRPQEALGASEAALGAWPDNPTLWSIRAQALLALDRDVDALASFERALALGARDPDVLGLATGCAMRLCDWEAFARLSDAFFARVETEVFAPGLALAFSDDPALHHRVARSWVAARTPQSIRPLRRATPGPRKKLRIAYLSADFRQHAVGVLFEELLAASDRDRFEIHGVSYGPDDASDVRHRLADGFDALHDVRDLGDRAAAERIAAAGADIAIDLMGHTFRARMGILSHRPAPVQVNYLGFPGTSGAPFIDYVLADAETLPMEQQPFYSERIVHLPGCYLPGAARRTFSTRTPTRADAGLPERAFVFCCFNASWKLTPELFAVWMRLLQAVDGAVLWLSAENPAAEANLRRQASAHGIDPARLVFKARAPFDEHLTLHGLADLFLDTLPYNAHATAADALWAGLPLLTCRGRSFAGRVAASLLHSAGLDDLVAPDLAAYEAMALDLARNPARLADLRERLVADGLRRRLFDADAHMRGLEDAFVRMWTRFERGGAPEGFAI